MAAANPTPIFYVFECVVEGCDAEFYLNDIPVIRRGPDLGTFFGGQSNQYVVDGENEIGIVVNPGPTPAKAMTGEAGRRQRTQADGAKAMARLVRYPFGAVVGGPSGEILMHCDWQAPAEGTSYVFPRAVSATTDLGEMFGSWHWQGADRIDLDEDVRGELGVFLEELRANLAAGDPEPFIELSRPRLKDLARAYSLPPGQKERQIRDVTELDARQPWWGMQPLDPETFAFRLCARGRLVELIGRDWEPVLKENPDEDGSLGQYGMLVGRLDGEWAILL